MFVITLQIIILEMENLDENEMTDKLTVKMQNMDKCIIELNKKILVQVFQEQQSNQNIKSIKEEDIFQNDHEI